MMVNKILKGMASEIENLESKINKINKNLNNKNRNDLKVKSLEKRLTELEQSFKDLLRVLMDTNAGILLEMLRK